MSATERASEEPDAGFTLDPALLAQRRAASARRLHTVQIPAIRGVGFTILCVMAAVHDLRTGAPFPQPSLWLLVAVNLGYAASSWRVLRSGYGRTGRVDLGLVFLHLDVLVWLVNLRHFEQGHLFFAYFLLVRVTDQIGFGFRRAFYFNHLVVAAYLAYSAALGLVEPGNTRWEDRFVIAATMYLLGIYLALTGLVTERLRNRSRQAVRTARGLVTALEQKTQVLQAQALELEHARRQSEQANVAKSQFLAVISHEIRTPMNGVLGTTELLLGTPLTERQRQYALTAHRSGKALLGLIDDVLDLSRLEARRLVLRSASVDLRALARDAVDLMSATTQDKPVTLGCHVAAALPERVQGDPERLRQLLVNLLHNAVKFTDRGSVRLDVTIAPTAATVGVGPHVAALLPPEGAATVLGRPGDSCSPDALRVRFAVSDTGIGIAGDHLDAVFDAFTQVDASSTRRHGGSGLGLAIVKELSALMGGEMGVESRLGEGSVFWFELDMLPSIGATPTTMPGTLEGGGWSARVLLAEDDPVNQLVVEQMLERLGCTVLVVGDGDAARQAAARSGCDMIFMDCHMPVMDGYEATRQIRETEEPLGRRTPIVALTAGASARDRERCFEAGMDDYLTKPVSISQLAAAVERWTGMAQPGASALAVDAAQER